MNELTATAAVPDSWPIVASDPGWELRRGPSSSMTTPDGSVVSANLAWSTDDGYAAQIQIDGCAISGLTDLTLEQLAGVSSVAARAATEWHRIETEGKNA